MNMKYILALILFILYSFILFSQTDSIIGTQEAFYGCSNSFKIDTTVIKSIPDKLYFQFLVNDDPKELDSVGLNWLKKDTLEYITSYLINNTDTTVKLTRQDGLLIMIQEALDEEGEWKPIEYLVPSGCGNSYFNPLYIDSGEYVIIPIRKYKGSFKTKIRLKFVYNREVHFSDSFDGLINKSQFERITKEVNGVMYDGPPSYLDKEEED